MKCKDFNYIVYKFGGENAATTREMRQHVKLCATCKKKIMEMEKLSTLMTGYYSATRELCPDAERLMEYASGGMAKQARAAMKKHIGLCTGCAQELRGLEAAQEVEFRLPALEAAPAAQAVEAASAGFSIKDIEKKIAGQLKIFKKKITFSGAFSAQFAERFYIPDPGSFSGSIQQQLHQPIMSFKENEKNKDLWEKVEEIQLLGSSGKAVKKKAAPHIKLVGSALKCSVPAGKSKKSGGK